MNNLQELVIISVGVSVYEANRAAKRLKAREIAVTVAGIATLIPGALEIRCVITAPTPAVARCEEEYKVMAENAARALRSSRLGPHLTDSHLRWEVVEVTGDDVIELWREP